MTVTDEDGLFDAETFNINTISPPPITPPVIDPPVVVPPPPPDRIAPTIVVTSTTDTILQRYKTSIGADFAIYFIATDDGTRITDLSQFVITVTNLPSGIFYLDKIIYVNAGRIITHLRWRVAPNSIDVWEGVVTLTATGQSGATATFDWPVRLELI